MAQKRAVVRQSLADVIVADLRNRILSGELYEGELIRQEVLAEEYDVSRMPIREALKRLDAEGLVIFNNNRGATVTKHSLEEIAEIFDIRALLEVDLLKRAIPQMQEPHFKACEAVLEELEDSYETGSASDWGLLNARYHNTLYEAAGRELTLNLLDRVSMLANRYVSLYLVNLIKSKGTEEDHRILLELVRQKDVEAAAQRLHQHIEGTKQRLLASIAKDRGEWR